MPPEEPADVLNAAVLSDAATALADAVTGSPWGTISRGELDFLLFRFLVDSGRIDLDRVDFDLANGLDTTVPKIRNLRYKYEQRSAKTDPATLARMLVPASFVFKKADGDGDIRVSITSRYLRELIVNDLHSAGVLALADTTSSVIVVPLDAFVATIVRLATGGTWAQEWDPDLVPLIEQLVAVRGETMAGAWEQWAQGNVPERVRNWASLASAVASVFRALQSAVR